MSSSLFFWYYQVFSDCQQINRREFGGFRVGTQESHIRELASLGSDLMRDYAKNSRIVKRVNNSRGITIEKEYFTINKSKTIIDLIDDVLAKMYGLEDEEVEFIKNYDIKYRIGQDGSADEE